MYKIQSNSLAVLAKQVKPYACELSRIRGFFNGTSADMYLHLFDTQKGAVADGQVPLRWWPLYKTSPFGEYVENYVLTRGMFFIVSTTRATLTAATGGSTVDLFVDGNAFIDDSGWESAVGDYTTNVAGLAVYGSSSGPKRLVRLEVTPLTSAGAKRDHTADFCGRETVPAAFRKGHAGGRPNRRYCSNRHTGQHPGRRVVRRPRAFYEGGWC